MTLRSVDQLRNVGPVRIDRIDVTRVAIPMHEPFRISSGEVSRKEATIIRLHNGIAHGWGESSAMPGAFYSADTPESCAQQLLSIAPEICGKSWRTMGEFEEFLIGESLSPFVRVAFEAAAWEMLACERQLSLRSMFGLGNAPVGSGLAVGLYPSLSDLRAAIERYQVRRYKRLKIKIKRGQDLALVEAVREWHGDLPLFVDANADYGAGDIEHLLRLDGYGLMMIEQPFSRNDLALSAQLQQMMKTPICFDEGIESVADVHAAVRAGACRIVNVKLQRVGGYMEALRIGEACLSEDIPLWMGTMPELGIGSAQALVLATHPANCFPTDVEESSRWYVDDILSPDLKLHDGNLNLCDGPGIGFSVDEVKLRQWSVGDWSFPQ